VTYPEASSTSDRLATRSPFHLEATARVLQRRPTNLVDVWDQDRYLRAFATTDGLALIQVSNQGSIDDPDLRLTVLRGDVSSITRVELGLTIRKMLGLDVDPAPLQRAGEAEPSLAPAALALRGMRPPRFAELFEAFLNVIPFQQLSLDAGVAIVGRLVSRFGQSFEHEGRRFHTVPAARDVAEAPLEALRESGLSRSKAETLRRVARAIESDELSEAQMSKMTSQEALLLLTGLKGVGPWTAGVVLLRGLGRLDVFPPGDVGVIRGLTRLLRLPAGQSLDAVVERFGECRGYLYFYSLGSSLVSKGLIYPAAPPRSRRRPASK
jgi:DNA-3-methyladenine glycosylase II